MESNVKLFDNGKRLDGRKIDELRNIYIEAGVLHRADGSCYLEWGNNKVMVAIYGPREALPKHTQNPLRAVVRARYNMAAFSVDERKRARCWIAVYTQRHPQHLFWRLKRKSKN